MPPDVVSILHGGLGNQLFQYAATLHVLRRLGGSSFELLFLPEHEAMYAQRPDLSDLIDVRMRLPSRGERARWKELSRSRSPLNGLFRASGALYSRVADASVITQRTPFDGETPLPVGRPICMRGHFQNPEWFHDTWRDVAEQLASRAPAGYAELVGRRRAVVHVRRGDYVDLLWDLPPAYYAEAMARVGLVDCEVVLVCDEPRFADWFLPVARSLGCTLAPVQRMTAHADVDAFWNLAAADRLVASNSTFAWWAAAVATARSTDLPVALPRPWIVNKWEDRIVPDFGLPGWTYVASGLPVHE